MLRFVDLCRKSCDVSSKKLTVTDILRAERIWTEAVQEESFEPELQSLQGRGTVTLLQKQLLDKDGIIHCQGRINHSNVSVNTKMMPPHHHFTDLLIWERHNQVFHDGIHETLNLTMEQNCICLYLSHYITHNLVVSFFAFKICNVDPQLWLASSHEFILKYSIM